MNEYGQPWRNGLAPANCKANWLFTHKSAIKMGKMSKNTQMNLWDSEKSENISQKDAMLLTQHLCMIIIKM